MKISGNATPNKMASVNKRTQQTSSLTKSTTVEYADNPALPGKQDL